MRLVHLFKASALVLAATSLLPVLAQSWPTKPIRWIVPYTPGGITDNATLYAGRLPYDPVKSFAPVSLVCITPMVMTVNNNLPFKNVKELIDYAKANPGKLAFGSSGVGQRPT